MSFEPHDYLRHILAEVEYLLDQSRTLTYERFVADQTLRRAQLGNYRRSSEEPAHRVPDIAS